MASVQEIIDRLAKEDPMYGLYRPGLGVHDTQQFNAVLQNGEPMTWLPNRKVVSGLVAGVVAAVSVKLFGSELDPETASAVTLAVVTLISYFVPLPEAPAEG
jgi:hypothetical protein